MAVHQLKWLTFAVAMIAGCSAPPGDRGAPARITRFGDDLLANGGEIRVQDHVVGDVMLAGGDMTFSGMAGGSLLAAGGNQGIGGSVAGSVRAAGGNVVLSANVGRNVTIVGGNVVLHPGAMITHNAYLAGGAVRVHGQVGRGVTALARDVVLDGIVGGDVQVSSGHLVVGPNARIAGALRYRVPPGSVTIDSAARITGGVTALPAAGRSGFGRVLRIIWFIGFLVAGAVAVALFPRLATAAVDAIHDRTGAAAAFGVVWLIGIPLLILVAAVTLIGLPLAAIVTAAYFILLYLGRAAVAVWLGDLLLRTWRPSTDVAPVLSFFIGAILLLLVGLVPLIGSFIGLVVAALGAGAVLVAIWPRRNPPQTIP